MKITRYKRVQRYISFYKNNFDFHPPYQILIDGTFCNAALNNKVNISEQMPKYLADEVKLLTTVCVVNECEKLSRQLYGAMLIVKKFAVHKCGHEKSPIGASDCLLSLAKNRDAHYMLATQDQQLTVKIRKLAHVPLIYLKMNTIVMEKPQDSALEIAEKCQDESLVNNHEFQTLKQLKQTQLGEQEATTSKRKRKGPKGANPLSCKKKKTSDKKKTSSTSSTTNNQQNGDNKRHRKRKNRIPNHIKKMMNKIENQLSS